MFSKQNPSFPEHHKSFEKMRGLLGDTDFRKLRRLVEDELKKPPRVAVIGKSGVGKSTTINALFGLDEKVSHTTHGTTEEKQQTIDLPEGGKLSVVDMPGLGEDIELDRQYQEIYRRVLPEADVVLYVIQADLKALSDDQEILREIVQNIMGHLKGRLVIGLNQVDRMSPGTWNTRFNYPSPEQEDNIHRRCHNIQDNLSDALGIKVDQVEYYSASKRYRLYELLSAVIKSAGKVGWKLPINPSDAIELADEEVREFLRKEIV